MTTTRRQKLDHIFKVLDIAQEVQDDLIKNQITSQGNLMNTSDEIWKEMVEDGTNKIKKTHVNLIMGFKKWYREKSAKTSSFILEVEFTEDEWDSWVSAKDDESTTSMVSEVKVQTTPKPVGYARRVIGDYPQYSGKNEDFTVFKNTFQAIAVAQNLGHLLEKEGYVEPDESDPEYENWIVDNKFLHSALLVSTAKGTATQFVTPFKASGNRRGSWLAMLDYYEGKASDNIAQQAMAKLSSLRLTRRNGVEKYISQFNRCLEDLRETGHPIDPVMAKITFLNQIHDRDFTTICEILRMDKTKTFEDCQTELRRCASAQSAQQQSDQHFRKLQQSNRHGKGNGQFKKGKGKGNSGKTNDLDFLHLPAEVIKNMSSQEYQQFKSLRSQLRHKMNVDGVSKPSIPSQYGQRSTNNAQASTDGNKGHSGNNGNDSGSVTSEMTDMMSRMLALTQSGSQFGNGNNRQGNLGTRYAYSGSSIGADEAVMIVDGGTDSTTVGRNCHVLEYTGRHANLSGFKDDLQASNLPIVSAAFAYDPPVGDTVILVFHEAVLIRDNSTSLLSCTQARFNGCIVNDVPLCFGGDQSLVVDDVTIPMVFENALLHLKLRRPTNSELSDCDHLVVTSDNEWNPARLQMKMSTVPPPGPVPGPRTTTKPKVDYSALHPFFGWLLALTEENDGYKIWKVKAILKHTILTGGGVEVLIEWENGAQTWEPIRTIRKDSPLLLTHYALENGLTQLKGWKWTKRFKHPEKYIRTRQLRKATKEVIKDFKRKYKFGVEIPRNIREAYALDKKNKNKAWGGAIDSEMGSVLGMETFIILEKGAPIPEGYVQIPYHWIFDVKFDGRRKGRLVAGGNWTSPDGEDFYSGVVTIDNVRIIILVSELNDLETVATDIGNAFLNGWCREKVYIIAGPEFGELEGRVLLVSKALYGLRGSPAAFHLHLSETLAELGFVPSKADSDIWMRDCGTHYEYIARYVDDLLVMSRDSMAIISKLEEVYTLKGTGTPEYYLGGDYLSVPWTVGSKKKTTAMAASTYIKRVVEKIEGLLDKTLRNYDSPMDSTYRPESDDTPLLNQQGISEYRMLIGCANWTVSLCRFDVYYATQTLARYMSAPREGHYKAMLRVIGYLKHHAKGKLIFDTGKLRDQGEAVDVSDWKEFYGDVKEEIPEDMPVPKGVSLETTIYVDADHASDVVTRRSVSGILFYVNGTPVKWYSKRQATVESSTYGSELVAARIATEMAIEMRYKLRMLGVPLAGPTLMFGDNKSVVLNLSVPSSVLKKKHNAIAYHKVRQCVAAGIVSLVHMPGKDNPADLLTKAVDVQTFKRLTRPILFRSFGIEGSVGN